MSPARALLRRDITLAFRAGGGAMLAVAFFGTIAANYARLRNVLDPTQSVRLKPTVLLGQVRGRLKAPTLSCRIRCPNFQDHS